MARTSQISMRIDPAQQAVITRAAQVQHIDRTTFILNAAYKAAEAVLLDQQLFQLDEHSFKLFNDALNEPVSTNTKLEELFEEPSPWEK